MPQWCQPTRPLPTARIGGPRRWLYLRARKRIVRPLCSRLHRDPGKDTRKSLLIAGSGPERDHVGAPPDRRASGTTLRSSAVKTGEDLVGGWRNYLSRSQIANILAVVDAFGLGYLYEDSVWPRTDS